MRRPRTRTVAALGTAALVTATLAASLASGGGGARASADLEPATGSVVSWNGRGQAPCPEGQTRTGRALTEQFDGGIPQSRFNRGFYTVGSAIGGQAARSLMPADGSRTRDHLFLNWATVSPGATTMIGFATRGSTPGGYYATVDVNSVAIQSWIGSTSWSGRVYDITPATRDEQGRLGTWFEHRAVNARRTYWDLDNVQIYTCRPAPVSRLAGSDRYATSALVSSRLPASPPVAYLVSGTDFADGVSASAYGAAQDAPVLLVRRDTLPEQVRTELARLRPQRVVAVGGTAAVSDAVLAEAAQYATTGQADRIGGADRYETSALLLAEGPDTPGTLYVASGAAFPDALTGGALAGHRGMPLVLTRQASLPTSVRTAVAELQPGSVVVLGGSASISESVVAELDQLTAGSVTRIAGEDRYGTAAAVAAQFPAGPARVYLATGTDFPDALSGAALAGSQSVPLLLSRPTTLPPVTASRAAALNAASGVLLGGTSALAPIVMDRLGGHVG